MKCGLKNWPCNTPTLHHTRYLERQLLCVAAGASNLPERKAEVYCHWATDEGWRKQSCRTPAPSVTMTHYQVEFCMQFVTAVWGPQPFSKFFTWWSWATQRLPCTQSQQTLTVKSMIVITELIYWLKTFLLCYCLKLMPIRFVPRTVTPNVNMFQLFSWWCLGNWTAWSCILFRVC